MELHSTPSVLGNVWQSSTITAICNSRGIESESMDARNSLDISGLPTKFCSCNELRGKIICRQQGKLALELKLLPPACEVDIGRL